MKIFGAIYAKKPDYFWLQKNWLKQLAEGNWIEKSEMHEEISMDDWYRAMRMKGGNELKVQRAAQSSSGDGGGEFQFRWHPCRSLFCPRFRWKSCFQFQLLLFQLHANWGRIRIILLSNSTFHDSQKKAGFNSYLFKRRYQWMILKFILRTNDAQQYWLILNEKCKYLDHNRFIFITRRKRAFFLWSIKPKQSKEMFLG